MSQSSAEFKYFLLADINLNVKVKINSLKGKEVAELIASGAFGSEVYVTCSICFNGRVIGLPASTSHQIVAPNRTIRWDEWLTLPVKYRDLPAKSCLVFTVWQIAAQETLQPNLSYKPPPDPGAVPVGGTTIPIFNSRGVLKTGHRRLFLWRGKEGDASDLNTTPYKAWKARGMEKLHKVIRKYDQNELRHGFWLDSLAIRRLQKLQDQNFEYDRFVGRAIGIADPPNSGGTLPDVDQFGAHIFLTIESPPFKHPIIYSQNMYAQRLQEISSFDNKNRLFVLHDPEMKRENPIENMYLKLARSIKGQVIDIRPKIDERKQLERIINSPNRQLSGAEKQLLVTFRYFLLENKRALTKFLRAVYWDDESEVENALELIPKWTSIDIADALELLSSAFSHPEVRKYAIEQLRRAEDDELQSYLLQLVQALRFEPDKEKSYLAKFLIDRCATSLELANYFYWYLIVEQDDRRGGDMFQMISRDFDAKLSETNQGQEWAASFKNQSKMIEKLSSLGSLARASNRKSEKRIERMRALLGSDFKELCSFPEKLRMPVRPEIEGTGLIPDKCIMLKSALAPMLLTYAAPDRDSNEYKVLFKSGDDLRQDQLVIQMINLMDSILKKVKLDLKLTPYRVLATSATSGFVEFVPDSSNLSKILADHNKNIGDFFQKNNRPADMQKVLETFVKSTAGYCVITYILGIGDRHLDNIMLTKTGHLFHIDFGYIFGRDPKPFPPPIKFCKEMVEAMGGANSPQYMDFRKYCCLAFNILRKHANLILNLLGLMGDADIPNVSADMDKTLMKVQDKFRLDLTDEEAEHYLLNLIDESMNALFPILMDKVHKWAMYWK